MNNSLYLAMVVNKRLADSLLESGPEGKIICSLREPEDPLEPWTVWKKSGLAFSLD